jgi:hypothetical protein
MEEQPIMDLAQVRQAIEAANVRFGEAARSGDAATLASHAGKIWTGQ